MKYENILERLDFSEFEQLFQLKKHKSGGPKKSKSKKKKCEDVIYYTLVDDCTTQLTVLLRKIPFAF